MIEESQWLFVKRDRIVELETQLAAALEEIKRLNEENRLREEEERDRELDHKFEHF